MCVPEGVNVPEFTNGVPEPDSVYVPEDGARVQVLPLVRTVFTVKLVLAVTAVDEQEVVRLLKESKVPEFVIAPPPLTVIVPAEGESVCEALFVKVPATVKLFDGWVPGVPAIVKL